VYTTDPELLTWIAEKFGKFRSRPLAESADRNYGIYIWDVDEPDAWWLITQLCLRGWEPFHAHKNPWEDEVWGDRWEFKKELLA
jgi:hypothetical protein